MNSKILYGAALSALMLTACSQESVIDVPVQTDAISFAVTNGATSRAAQSQCNTNMPASFKVSAAKAGTNEFYFQGDVVNKLSGTVNSYQSEIERYWPEYDLDFHAWTNDGGTYAHNGTAAQFVNFTPSKNVAEQLDLLYAVQPAQSTKDRKTVKLNFRHALSQIVFAARNESRLNISISAVEVAHLNTVGTYTLGKASTMENYENHEEIVTPDPRTGLGEWNGVEASALDNYSVAFGAQNITSTTMDLTSVNHKGGPDNSLILLPQTQKAWTPGSAEGVKDAAGYNGAYFAVSVSIKDGDKDVYNGQALVPVDIDWFQGRRYKYTFIFTEGGNGGFQPGDPDNPTPVLSGIKYEVSTDDFVPVDPTDVPMNGGNSGNEDPKPEEKTTYTVNYFGNGAQGEMAPQTASVVEATYSFTAKANEFTFEGYEFLGWNTAADGTGTAVKAGDAINLTKENNTVNLYAQWKEKVVETTYIIRFHQNMEGQKVYYMPEDVEVKSNDATFSYTLPENGPQTDGVFCHGWTIVKDDTNIDYKNGATVTLDRNKPVIDLYVAWRQGTPAGGSGDIIGTDPTVKP